jgi:hypothetical protein
MGDEFIAYDLQAKYRNVQLFSALLRTDTEVLAGRLNEWLQRGDIISHSQRGFRKCRRTTSYFCIKDSNR